MFCNCLVIPPKQQPPLTCHAELEELDHANKVALQLLRIDNNTQPFSQRFQACLDSLQPKDVVDLKIEYTAESPAILNELVLNPGVSRIRAIHIFAVGAFELDTQPMLQFIERNSQLSTLSLFGKHFPSLQFATAVLQLATQNIRVLIIHPQDTRHFSQFFQALSRSKVLRFDLRGVDYAPYQRQLAKFIALDKLQSLCLSIVDPTNERIMFRAMSRCLMLKELQLSSTVDFATIHLFPRSITKLTLISCTLKVEASSRFCTYLITSLLSHLCLSGVRGLNCAELGKALSRSLQCLDISFLQDVDNLLPALCLGMQQPNSLKTLSISHCPLYDESTKLLADMLLYESCALHTLVFARNNVSAESVERFLCPALKNPNCTIKRFEVGSLNGAYGMEYITAMENANAAFALRLQRETVLVLIQQKQAPHRHRLNRLPIEMFRLLGEMLFY